MKRILGIVGALLLLMGSVTAGLCAPGDPVEIFYDLTQLSVDTWEYSYTVQNHSLIGARGYGVIMFDTFFPVDETSILPAGTPPNWNPLTFEPNTPGVHGGPSGIYDAQSPNTPIIGRSPIDPGESLSGFNVTFHSAGTPPGPQYFEVVDPNTEDGDWLKILASGYTTPFPVPEPLSGFMFAFGLFGLAVARRKR